MSKRSLRETQQPLSKTILGNGEEVLREKLTKLDEQISELRNSPYTRRAFSSMTTDIENKEDFLDAAHSHLNASVYNEAKKLIEKRKIAVESYNSKVKLVEEKIGQLEAVKEKIHILLREIEKNKKRESYLMSKGKYGTSIFGNESILDDDLALLESETIGQVKEIERKNKMLNHTIDAYESLGKDGNDE